MTTKIVVWNREDYTTRKEAEKDGATTTHTIPNNVDEGMIDTYVDAFRYGLLCSGERLKSEVNALGYELIEIKEYCMNADILEWNRYSFVVEAESEEEAIKLVKENGALSYSSIDIEWGVDSAPTGLEDTRNILAAS